MSVLRDAAPRFDRKSVRSRNSRSSVSADEGEKERRCSQPGQEVTLFQCIEQLSCSEHVLWNLLDGLKTQATHLSFFCREYWNSAASIAQLSIDKYFIKNEASMQLRKQVHTACLLESLSMGIMSLYASGTMDTVTYHLMLPNVCSK